MKMIRDTIIIAWMNFYPFVKRQPLQLVGLNLGGIFPLFFMWIFGGEGGLLNQGVVGAMVSTVGFVGAMVPIQTIAWDRYVKIREMIVAMPVHPISYAFGISLGTLLFSVPGVILFMAIAAWLGVLQISAVFWVVIALVLCWSSLSAMGFMIAMYLIRANPYTLNNMSLILSFILIFVPPVYYPEEMLGNYSWVSVLVPTSNAANIMRAHLGLSTSIFGGIAFRWLALITTTVLFTLLASFKARWREN